MGKVAGKKKKKNQNDVNNKYPVTNSTFNSSDSDSDTRKRKKSRLPTSNSTSDDRSANPDHDLVAKSEKVTEALQGSPSVSGPTQPLPDKKLLVYILDRLQKKDTHKVFSEPVDPDELPDYYEIIKNPMDFTTLKKKLDDGIYSKLDDFEADVFLICSNAMLYNAPDTVYFRQAKSILDIAKRDFQYLRQVNEEGEPQPRIVKRGRPPNLKKILNTPPNERVRPESISDATLATPEDNNKNNTIINTNNSNTNAAGSNSYNLRKGLPSFRFQSTDAFLSASPQSLNNETHENRTDWNSEFPAKILRADAKYGKKQFSMDENRRDTYKQFHSSSFSHDSSSLASLNGNMKQLIGVGLNSEYGYARSLARFASNLGPVVWKIASKKIEKVLPSGVNYGPGWVGESDALPQPHLHAGQATSEGVAGEMSYNEKSVSQNSALEAQQKLFLDNRNGFNNLQGYDYSKQAEMLRASMNMPRYGQHQSGFQEIHPTVPTQTSNSNNSPQLFSPVSENAPSQQQRLYSSVNQVPQDLNMRFQELGSSNSSFRIGSPQPDLALQL